MKLSLISVLKESNEANVFLTPSDYIDFDDRDGECFIHGARALSFALQLMPILKEIHPAIRYGAENISLKGENALKLRELILKYKERRKQNI